MFKISIITVCFNSEKTILDTINSVNRQSYKNLEHIFIDGGSTDGTLSLINTYSRREPELVSERDRGIYDAMNKGLNKASGEIIAFLNSDDIYANENVIKKIAYEMHNNNLDCLAGDVYLVKSSDISKIIRRSSSKRFSVNRIAYGWMPSQPALFFKKSVYDEIGFFSSNYRIAGDFEFVARAFLAKDIKYKYIPDILVHMRLGGVSTGGLFNTLLLNKEVMRACRENGINTNWFKLLSKYPYKILEYFFH